MPQQEADKQEQAEASNSATSAQCLEPLRSNPHLRSAIAGNPAAPAQVLEQLATDQDAQVREQVAGNPNTPWLILERLAWEFPRQFLHNSAGPLQILAHPGQISIAAPSRWTQTRVHHQLNVLHSCRAEGAQNTVTP